MDARRLWRAGAPTRAIHALPSPPSSHLPTFSNGRTAALPCGRAHARHPRTTVSSLFPMKNWHSWFPLLKWTHGCSAVRARPRAPSTHCLLLPPPSSLLCTPFSSLLPVPYFFFFLVEKFGGMYILDVLTPALPGVRCGVIRHDNRICPSAESHAGGFFSPRFGQASTVAYLPYCEAWPGLKKPQ